MATAPDVPTVQRLEAHASTIGADMRILRALPHRERRMVGAWCFLDHAGPVQFSPGKGMHVGPHPHIGLQTFTWMIEGEVMHRDSLGHAQVVRPGQVNLMTAGRGIAHSEDTVSDGARLHLAQLWIALPDAERACAPAFAHHPDLPVVEVDGLRITVLVGRALGQTSPVSVHSPLLGLDLVNVQAAQTTLALDPAFEHGVLVLRGQATVGDEALAPGALLYLGTGHEALRLQCAPDSQVLLLGGTPFGQDVLLWWNFVGRDQAELAEALADWNGHSPRFGSVPGAETAPLLGPSLDGLRLKAHP